MKLLLDTHAFLWMATNPARLSAKAQSALAHVDNERFVSSASVWEMAIHHRGPFDRLLVAQAQEESLVLVTSDPLVAQYDVTTVW